MSPPTDARKSREARREPRLRLNHVGVAVADLDGARERWERVLGEPSSEPEDVESEGVRVSFFATAAGDRGKRSGPRVELVSSARDDSAIARYLSRRPEGMHHMCFEVEEPALDVWFDELRARGVRVLGDGPSEGAGGTRVFFVHPESTGGVLVEFAQHAQLGQETEGPRP